MKGKFPKAFRQGAVDRLTQCDNIVELAKELGMSRRLLYTWSEKLEPRESNRPPVSSREAILRKEVSQLKRVLAEKVLEVDCFKGVSLSIRPPNSMTSVVSTSGRGCQVRKALSHVF